MPENTNREREIFDAALECATAAERAACLDRACGGDAALRARLEKLLLAHEEAGGFFADQPAGSPKPSPEAMLSEGPGTRIGRYKLLERIGEGGFGVVYMAEQQEPVLRRVALKIIKLGMDTRAVVARFEAERQALAMMDHPNIAKVLDGGVTESGRPYFVMDLVRGVSITAFCDEHRLAMRERIDLFVQVCHAIQHAHQKGVIHRDLKPSNILVTMHDDRPVPKVIDFGIAKATQQRLTEKTLFTQFHQFVGTPAYMSPEQTGISGLDIDTRSDIYSLGVLLYELLTDRTPFDTKSLLAAGYAEIERAIREQDPPAPSKRLAALTPEEQTTTAERRRSSPARLVNHLRGDLDRIVAKCLQKDRTRRYETANGIAMDLGRYLRHEPVLARPDSIAYRASRFVRRHRWAVLSVAVFLMVILAGLAGTFTQARRAQRHAARAEAERNFAWRQLARAEAINDLSYFLLSDAAPAGEPLTVGALLARAEEVIDRELANTEENRIEMLVSIGRQYWSLDMDGRAREVLERAYARAAARPELGLRPYAGATLANLLTRTGELQRAEDLIVSALAELGDLPENALTRAYCLKCGADVALDRGDPATGIARAEEARAIVDRLPFSSGLQRLSVAMGVADAYRSGGRHREAAAAFASAWEQLVTLGRERTEKASTLLNNWGLALFSLGRSREAEPLFRRAVAIAAHEGNHTHVSPMLLNNFARALHDLGSLEEATELAHQALARARELGDETVINQALLNVGRLAVDRGDATAGAAALAEVEPRLRAVLPAGHYAFAALESLRAGVELARGDAEAALAPAHRAVEIIESATQGREFLAAFLVRRSDVHLRLGQPERARTDAERAIASDRARIQPGEVSISLGRGWLALARAHRALGDNASARAACAAALEQLRPTLGDDHPQTREAAAGASAPML